MSKKIISILLILMINIVTISAVSSSPISTITQSKELDPEPAALTVMIFCVIDIEGEGNIVSLPGFLFWKITDGNIKITYLGGEYTATSGSGFFVLHLGSNTNNPVDIKGVAPIGIVM